MGEYSMSATIASSSPPPPAPAEAIISKINTNRILANGAVGFFTALLPLIAVLGLSMESLQLALLGAIIQGGLAAAQEYKKEADTYGNSPPTYEPPAALSLLVF